MTLTQAIFIARYLLAEHGGIELQIDGTNARMVPVNPDNDEQIENAAAYNLLASLAMLREHG